MYRSSVSSGKNFAKVGAIFSGTECAIEGLRAKNDLYNGVAGGCITGGVLARNAGPQAVAVGCAGFAVFSAAIDAYMVSGVFGLDWGVERVLTMNRECLRTSEADRLRRAARMLLGRVVCIKRSAGCICTVYHTQLSTGVARTALGGVLDLTMMEWLCIYDHVCILSNEGSVQRTSQNHCCACWMPMEHARVDACV